MAVTYNYQLQYEMCSLVFLLAITFQFVFAKRFPTRTNMVFVEILFCSVGSLSMDILGCLTVMHVINVPIWLNYLINGLFYFCQVTLPGLTCIYVLMATNCTYKEHPKAFLIMIPGAAFMLLQFINPFTGLMFYFEVIEGIAYFHIGPWYPIYYGGAVFYQMVLIALIIALRKRLTREQIVTIAFFIFIVSLAMLIQILNPDLILTGTAITFSIMLWDLTLQNPDSMVENETRLFNSRALRFYLNERVGSYDSYFVVMEINGLSSTETEIGNHSNKKLMEGIGTFLSSLSSYRVPRSFRESKTRFWIGVKNREEMEDVFSKIVERFRKPWKAGEMKIDLMANILNVNAGTSFSITTPEFIAIINELLDSESNFSDQFSVVNIDKEHLEEHRRRQLLEQSMRRSIKSGDGFYACFQPIVDVQNPSFASAEVLLRYNDRDLGAVSPAEFIQVIEQGGMAVYIDSFVVDLSCRFLAEHPEVDMLHINLSGAEFFHNPMKRISNIVRKNGIDPGRICFEITESVAAMNPDHLMSFMTQMIDLGFCFALDDFGTGYSNIIQVLKLPFSTVKIDKALLDDTENGRTFLAATIRLFKDLGKEIVIEGIESESLLERVVSLGGRLIQGYLYSPPLTESDYIEFVKNEKSAR